MSESSSDGTCKSENDVGTCSDHINKADTSSENSSNVEIDEVLSNNLNSLSLENESTEIENLSEHDDRIFYLHINVDGLTSKTENFKKLKDLVENRYKNKIDVVCITEPNCPDEDIELKGYDLYKSFTKGPKGGAAVYVKKSSEKFSDVEELKKVQKEEFRACDHGCNFCVEVLRYETVWIQFKRNRDSKMIVIGTIYRHPDKKTDRIECFVHKLDKALDRSEVKGKLFYLLGDFNIDLLKKSESDGLLEMLEGHGSEPLNKTDPTTTNETVIDHIHTNDSPATNPEGGVDRSIVFKPHYPIYCKK